MTAVSSPSNRTLSKMLAKEACEVWSSYNCIRLYLRLRCDIILRNEPPSISSEVPAKKIGLVFVTSLEDTWCCVLGLPPGVRSNERGLSDESELDVIVSKFWRL